MEQGTEASRILADLDPFGSVLAVKLYRLRLEPRPAIPILPCLDHEALLHEGVAPHLAAYRERREKEGLTEGAAEVEIYRSLTD